MGTVNNLYYGDNLDVLRRYIPDESVDLIYLDPPFKSDQDYNILFQEQNGTRSSAQIKAFEDTWQWDQSAAMAYQGVVEAGGSVSRVMQAFRAFLGDSDMLAYLSMMAPRLVELRRVLRATGTIYLHCDPTANHYLKLLMDSIFDPRQFLNEVTWKRTHSHGNVGRNFGSIFDVLLAYTKTDRYTWNQVYTPFSDEYVQKTFKYLEKSGRRWQSVTLRNPGPRPNLRYVYKASNGESYHPHPNGWVCDETRMRQLDKEDRLHFPSSPDGALRLKMYLDESPGVRLQNIWDDIPAIGSRAAERLGYPTQKPVALLERIISVSSNGGDIVLDPFCGCGTTIAAAQKLDRQWIGIDITHLAITLIKQRLWDSFEEKAGYKVIGEPVSLTEATALANADRFQFQWWALGLVGARPTEQKKGADQGIDGRLYFHDEGANGTTKQIVLSVKSGGVSVRDVRDLRGVLEREQATLAVLLTLEKPTRPMRSEAASAGIYSSPWGTKHPVMQILTIEDLLDNRGIDYPHRTNRTFKRAPRRASHDDSSQTLML